MCAQSRADDRWRGRFRDLGRSLLVIHSEYSPRMASMSAGVTFWPFLKYAMLERLPQSWTLDSHARRWWIATARLHVDHLVVVDFTNLFFHFKAPQLPFGFEDSMNMFELICCFHCIVGNSCEHSCEFECILNFVSSRLFVMRGEIRCVIVGGSLAPNRAVSCSLWKFPRLWIQTSSRFVSSRRWSCVAKSDPSLSATRETAEVDRGWFAMIRFLMSLPRLKFDK